LVSGQIHKTDRSFWLIFFLFAQKEVNKKKIALFKLALTPPPLMSLGLLYKFTR